MGLVIPNQRIDPFMADSDAIGAGHETADLFRAPFVPQLSGYPADQAGQALGRLPGKPASPVAEDLGLLRVITMAASVATDLPTDRAAVNAKLTGDPALACPGLKMGKYLISLLLGQLSVSHALLHFGR